MTNTQQIAKDKITPAIGSIKNKILGAIELHPAGLSRTELLFVTGIHGNSLSGRITELKRAGLIKKSGVRYNERGNPEDVYVLGDGVPENKRTPPLKLSVERTTEVLHSLGISASCLSGAFIWKDSPEGRDFWKRVHYGLSEYYTD